MLRNSEYAFYAFRVADANLNVSFGIKSRTIKYWSTLKKDAANRIYGCFASVLSDVMQQTNYSAVEIAPHLI